MEITKATPTVPARYEPIAYTSTIDLAHKRLLALNDLGRGVTVWTFPVRLEPALELYRALMEVRVPPTDDGLRPTIWSEFVNRLQGFFLERQTKKEPVVEFDASVLAFPDERRIIELQIFLPPQLNIPSQLSEHLLLSLSLCERPLSFEVVANDAGIGVIVTVEESDAAILEAQLAAYIPDAVVVKHSEYLASRW
ncbi:MAG: hypothetical protein AAB288_08590, partial [Acidobacteriota bacterium]